MPHVQLADPSQMSPLPHVMPQSTGCSQLSRTVPHLLLHVEVLEFGRQQRDVATSHTWSNPVQLVLQSIVPPHPSSDAALHLPG